MSPPNRAHRASFRILGVIIFVSGLATLFMRLERFLESWTARSPALQRAWCALAFVLGLFLIYAVAP
jgi:hypothetical protein